MDNTIVFGATEQGIMQVSADGGTAETLIEAKSGRYFDPEILPDGKSVIFARGDAGVQKICAQSLNSNDPSYLPSGHLVYRLDDDLFAIPFNADTLEVTGGPVSVAEGVGQLWLFIRYGGTKV